MKKIVLIGAAAICLANATYAQFSEFMNSDAPSNFTLNSDNNTLQLAGRVSAFYEWRDLKTGPGTTDNFHHNGFWPKDLDLDLLGKTTSKFVYEMHVSLLDITTAAVTGNNVNATTFTNAAPDAPGIKAMYMMYTGFKVHIKLGYDKIPFSQWSMSDSYNTPFWSHPNLCKGDFFNRRDFGLTLNSRLWQNRINLYAGVYTGVGEEVFEYGPDASGTSEYVGRAEFSYPGKMDYKIIDLEGAPTPIFRIAADVRYEDKKQPAGHTLSADVPDALGTYGLNLIAGKKTVYGMDFIAKYKGLSFVFEADEIYAQPATASDALFMGTTAAQNGGYVKAGGITTGINYNWKPKKCVFSLNYEYLNANDLAKGHEEWLHLGYAYTVTRFNSVFKVEWYRPVVEDQSNPLKYNSELRIGYQIVF